MTFFNTNKHICNYSILQNNHSSQYSDTLINIKGRKQPFFAFITMTF